MSGPVLMSGQMRYLLVVDSDWNERYTLSMLLQRFGYTVASSSSAAEAIEFLCVAPALAIFAEGGTVCDEMRSRLRADTRFSDVPLVMVADRVGPGGDAPQGGEGLAGRIVTPADPDEVYKAIQRVIEQGPRRNIRIPTGLPATLRDEYGETDGYVTVLSQLGMFFRTLEPRPENSQVSVDIRFWDRSVSVAAQVLYIVSFEEGPFSEPGLGLKFSTIGPEGSGLIRSFIYEQLGGGAPPAPGLAEVSGRA